MRAYPATVIANVAAQLAAGACGDDGRWLGAMLSAHLALSLENPMARRNAALRALGELLAPKGSTRVQAASIHRAMARYEPRWFRVDQYRSTAPSDYAAGGEKALLFEIYSKSSGRPPASETQLARLLSPSTATRIVLHIEMLRELEDGPGLGTTRSDDAAADRNDENLRRGQRAATAPRRPGRTRRDGAPKG